jgi:hypothetical protein
VGAYLGGDLASMRAGLAHHGPGGNLFSGGGAVHVLRGFGDHFYGSRFWASLPYAANTSDTRFRCQTVLKNF